MTTADWLKIYGEGVNNHGINIDQLIRETKHPEQYQEDLEQGQT